MESNIIPGALGVRFTAQALFSQRSSPPMPSIGSSQCVTGHSLVFMEATLNDNIYIRINSSFIIFILWSYSLNFKAVFFQLFQAPLFPARLTPTTPKTLSTPHPRTCDHTFVDTWTSRFWDPAHSVL